MSQEISSLYVVMKKGKTTILIGAVDDVFTPTIIESYTIKDLLHNKEDIRALIESYASENNSISNMLHVFSGYAPPSLEELFRLDNLYMNAVNQMIYINKSRILLSTIYQLLTAGYKPQLVTDISNLEDSHFILDNLASKHKPAQPSESMFNTEGDEDGESDSEYMMESLFIGR